MLEYVFKKAELAKLIKESPDSDNGNVIIQLAFSFGDAPGTFKAKVWAFNEENEAVGVTGCPRPPGCG
ncbi:hypothetical protein [Spirosoma sp. KNUC1025]|uniref:hypothetical protein n=1 Tax=Spirosoma sp. KNUC1025 TaxID=2894082 RepID=UPI00386A9FD2|nr:hypothetical protein LN737_27910 [Spirosoma sp. KNUC1025]